MGDLFSVMVLKTLNTLRDQRAY